MSMLLQGDDGTEFELAVNEDHLADLQDGAHDGTTITLSFRVATPEVSWEETVPCLNRFELQNLIEWLGAVGAGTPDEAEMEMLAPELSFSVIYLNGDRVTVRVGFHLDARPEEFDIAPAHDYDHIDLKLTKTQIRAASMEMVRDLEELNLAGDDYSDEDAPVGSERTPAQDMAVMDMMEDDSEGVRRADE